MPDIAVFLAAAVAVALLWWAARPAGARTREAHLCRLFGLDPSDWRVIDDDLDQRRGRQRPPLMNGEVIGRPDATFRHRRRRRFVVGEYKSRRWKGRVRWRERYQTTLYAGLAAKVYRARPGAVQAVIRYRDHLVEVAFVPEVFRALMALTGEWRRAMAGRPVRDDRPLFQRGAHDAGVVASNVRRAKAPWRASAALLAAVFAGPLSAQDAAPIEALEGQAVEAIAEAGVEEVEPIPIEGMDRITLADGRTYYLSRDRRFLFLGEMVDLWTGESVSELTEFDRVDFSRTGLTPPDFAVPMGGEGPRWVLFVAPSCPSCREAFDEAMALAEADDIELWVAPLWRNPDDHRRVVSVWCAKNNSDKLARVMRHTRENETTGCQGDQARGQASLAMAFAHAFRLPALPAAISPADRLVAGAELAEAKTYQTAEDTP